MISFILWNHPNETSIIIISSLVKVVKKRHRKFFKSTHSKQETNSWSRAVWFLRLFSPTDDILSSMLFGILFDKVSSFLVKKYLWKHFKYTSVVNRSMWPPIFHFLHCQYVLICVKRLRVFVHFPSFFLHVLLRYTRCGKEHKWTHVLRLCLTCFTVWTDQGPVIWKACPLSRDDYIRSYFPALLGGYLKPKPLLVGTCLLLPPHLPYPQISSSGTHSPPAPPTS